METEPCSVLASTAIPSRPHTQAGFPRQEQVQEPGKSLTSQMGPRARLWLPPPRPAKLPPTHTASCKAQGSQPLLCHPLLRGPRQLAGHGEPWRGPIWRLGPPPTQGPRNAACTLRGQPNAPAPPPEEAQGARPALLGGRHAQRPRRGLRSALAEPEGKNSFKMKPPGKARGASPPTGSDLSALPFEQRGPPALSGCAGRVRRQLLAPTGRGRRQPARSRAS